MAKSNPDIILLGQRGCQCTRSRKLGRYGNQLNGTLQLCFAVQSLQTDVARLMEKFRGVSALYAISALDSSN